MSDLTNEDDQFQSSEKFLEGLGEYKIPENKNIARMSLFRQFDPLVDQTPVKSSNLPTNNVPDNSISHSGNTIQDNHNEVPAENEEQQINTSNLINITPIKKENLDQPIVDNVSHVNGEEINSKQLKSENETLKFLMEELMLVTDQVVNSINKKLSNILQNVDQKDEELNQLNMIKGQLEEDINGVEKSYYEIHSRYNQLRTLVKELDQREGQTKQTLQELSNKLREKDQECRQVRQQAEEAIEQANQRIQNNNETISLKAQIKVLEMRVNSLQTQLEQKNIENEELSTIVNDLIANKKSSGN